MPNRRSLPFPAVAAAAAALLGLLLPAARVCADDIPVGEFASLTGGNATFGQSAHDGTALAIDEINAAGGELGRQLHLITEDDRSTAGEPANIVRKLISSDKVVAILGEVASSKSLEAAPICQSSHIPMISPASTNPKVTEVGDYIFRVCFIDPFQGTVMAKFALDTLLAKRVALLTDVKQDYSQGLAQYFKEYFTSHGGQITSEKSYSSGDKDFRAQLTAIKADKPDAIFVPGYYTEVGLIARQARSLGIKAPLLGGDGWDSPELVPVGGSALEGDYFSDHFSTQNGAAVVQDFIKKYQAKYGAVPDAMAALGHDSAMILADAIKRAGTTDGEKLRDAIAATKDYQGVTGTITLDASRNASKPAVILEVKDKAFKYITTVKP
jgi:branched-chain amino acid transport system substrate-binding protein